jgi:Ribulose 1,5-bisphosphate carboxylase, large subunit
MFNLYDFDFPEVSLDNDYVIATYYIKSRTHDVVTLATAIADEQSTGTWVSVPGETNEIKMEFGARVLNIFEVPDYEFEVPPDVDERDYIVQIGYPTKNFGPQIPMLYTAVIGNIANSGKLKLIDLNFPKEYVKGFKGPKFGIEGLREILNIPERPFVNNMVKPCTGWKPDDGAAMCYQVAKGGVDIIKDDELLMADPDWCPIEERTEKIMAKLKQAEEETGEGTLYTVNITDKVGKMKDNAMRALEKGANALMVNTYTIGFPAAQAIFEDPDINVPILAHVDYSGGLFGSPYNGISSPLLMGKLARMIGADLAIITSPYGKFPVVHSKYMMQCVEATAPLFGLKKMLPCISGGTTQPTTPAVMRDLGNDVCMAAGGAVHGHPMGPEAGARAMRQAIDAVMAGKSLEEYAQDHEELRVSLEKWGDPKANFDLLK